MEQRTCRDCAAPLCRTNGVTCVACRRAEGVRQTFRRVARFRRRCQGCGCILPTSGRERNRRLWCSQACKARLGRREAGTYVSRSEMRQCIRCGVEFAAALPAAKYCSRRCGWLHRAELRPKCPEWAAGRRRERPLPCRLCGQLVLSRASKATCEPCRKIAQQAVNARKNHKRRAVGTSDFDLVAVGDRDRWKCHICGRRVAKTLSGNNPMGPTIDHLVPVAEGGGNTMANVALAHRRCNIQRGTGGAAQLRLVG